MADYSWRELLSGHFTRRTLRVYLISMTAIFWGLIGASWLLYPAENRYSIFTHTFSFLGSSEHFHNPRWWWLFTVAMVFWGIALVPLSLYLYRRFSTVSRWGAVVAGIFFLVGSVNICLIGIFPDIPDLFYGDWSYTEIHERVALASIATIGLGTFWLGGLVLVDRYWPGRTQHALSHRLLIAPFLLWYGMVAFAAYLEITWGMMYAELKAQAKAEGIKIGSWWDESLNTIYAFPFRENLIIYTIFFFLVWLAWALAPRKVE